MHREKRQNRITEQRKIQKEICRILLIFTMILSMICVVNLTGCRDRKSQEQTELISLDGRDRMWKKQMEILQKRLKDQKRERMII